MEEVVDTYRNQAPLYVTYREDINSILVNGYEVDNDRQTSNKNKPSDIDQVTDQTRYKWDGNRMEFTIGGQQDMEDIQQNFMLFTEKY